MSLASISSYRLRDDVFLFFLFFCGQSWGAIHHVSFRGWRISSLSLCWCTAPQLEIALEIDGRFVIIVCSAVVSVHDGTVRRTHHWSRTGNAPKGRWIKRKGRNRTAGGAYDEFSGSVSSFSNEGSDTFRAHQAPHTRLDMGWLKVISHRVGRCDARSWCNVQRGLDPRSLL